MDLKVWVRIGELRSQGWFDYGVAMDIKKSKQI